MLGEIHGSGADNHLFTVGALAHEMGKDLSLPALYDIDGTSAGVGDWSVMGSGSWNGLTDPGDTPALPDAWSKWYLGWITPTPIEEGSHDHTLDQAALNSDILFLWKNPGGVDWDLNKKSGIGEYWLVENRQQVGFDAALPGCGLLIWHIDETVRADSGANADESRPLVNLVQADGLDELQNGSNYGDTGDPYPGSTGNGFFSSSSTPRAAYYTGTGSGIPISVLSTSCAAIMVLNAAAPVMDEQVFLPEASQFHRVSGNVTFRGLPASHFEVILKAVPVGKTYWINLYSTYTNAKGYYQFEPPSSKLYSMYAVHWLPPQFTFDYISDWTCDTITGLPTDKYTCDFETSGIHLIAPPSEASATLPTLFQWQKRGISSDRYQIFFLCEYCDEYNVYTTDILSYRSSYTLADLDDLRPYWRGEGPAPATLYRWTIIVYGPNGYSRSSEGRYVIFKNRGGPALKE